MANFDSHDYSIEDRLPEWWKGLGALEPVNEYTQRLISEILQGLLTSMGVTQPLNCWKTIPEEYNWYHHYTPTDDLLYDETITDTVSNAVNTLFVGNTMHVALPNTKRDCHAKIQLKLLGRDVGARGNGEIPDRYGTIVSSKEIIEELTLTNANQKIILKNVPSVSTIEILTESNEILIDGEKRYDLIEGSFDKIKPTIKNADYNYPHVDKEWQIFEIDTKDFDWYHNLTFTSSKGKTFLEYIHFIPKDSTSLNEILKAEELLLEKNGWNFDPQYCLLESKTVNFIPKDGEEASLSKKINFDNIKKIRFRCKSEEMSDFAIYIGNEKVFGGFDPDTKEDEKDRFKPLDLEDENKKTEITIHSTKTVNFDLQIYLLKPTYTIEQNIRLATVSAFPLEYVRLYGYFCHPFNNKSGYKYLWEKTYTEESRTVYDRITMQYDCERFYIEVKFYGIGACLYKGFPQSYSESSITFLPNPNLDKWGKIYGLPRRAYKPKITKDEEPFTFPKYYPYQIEQDYWYEERMVNEYQYNPDAVNALFIRDDSFENIGKLECIYPFTDDIWVYTETIDPTTDKTRCLKDIPLMEAKQDNTSAGKDWENLENIKTQPAYITLTPKNPEINKTNNISYRTKTIKCSFCLNSYKDEIPKDITIKGIELKFKTNTNIQSKTIKLSREDSKIILPYLKPKFGASNNNEKEWIKEKIEIIEKDDVWLKNKSYYTIGGENEIFKENMISREQLFEGNDGKLEFELVFYNDNSFIESVFYIEDISLNLYYEIIPNDYDVNVRFNTKEIVVGDNNTPNEVKMFIDVKNNGNIEVNDKEILIILPQELKLRNKSNVFTINLDVGESFVIGNDTGKEIIITPKADSQTGLIQFGWYDVLVICEDKVISNEILVRGKK